MSLDNTQIESLLEDALALAESNYPEFKKRLKVSYEHELTHQALHTNFRIAYIAPSAGEVIAHIDSMLWNDVDDILENGIESHEIREYDSFSDFSNQMFVKTDASEKFNGWEESKSDTINELMGDLAGIYTRKIKMDEWLPNWKNEILQKVKDCYGDVEN